jgi:polynucleotide 5'-triphosphatase
MSASGSDSEPGAPRGPLPPLSVSILGVDPQDELIREVADFVYATISARAHDLGDARIEVEAKVGVVRERASGQRLMLPVTCETGAFTLWRMSELRALNEGHSTQS